jgi:RNA-directed DNA polymerase
MSSRKAARQYARIIAHSGTAELEQLLRFSVGNRPRWVAKLIRAIDELFGGKRPSVHALTEFILREPAFRPVFVGRDTSEENPPAMNPADGRPRDWKVPPIPTVGDLAQWLNLRPNDLNWFADPRGLEHDSALKLCHYKRTWRRKRDGTFRLIESPKQRLKAIQRAVLHHVLEKIPTHECCHGFVAGRSILTCAAPHSGKALVLKMDIKDFFPTFRFARVQNIFLTAGYPENVARLLTGLCTTVCPRRDFKTFHAINILPRAFFTRENICHRARRLPRCSAALELLIWTVASLVWRKSRARPTRATLTI